MIYNYTITCITTTNMLFFYYTDISSNDIKFNLISGQSFSYSGEFAPFMIAPFPTNLFDITITIT
jgi:hypothetical protein